MPLLLLLLLQLLQRAGCKPCCCQRAVMLAESAQLAADKLLSAAQVAG